MADEFVVYGQKGTGSITVEATLTLLGLPYRVEETTLRGREAAERYARTNPMRQLPALRLPSGEIMTESAAIMIWLADLHPAASLAPAPDDPRRAQFLRWMTFIPASIYSMFWVRDEPSRLAADKAGEAVIKTRTADRIAECWSIMDSQISPGEFILGDRMTVLDVYVTIVSHWTPGRTRFYEVAPRMAPAVRRVDRDPRLQALLKRRM
jgi:GST-like protein